MRQKAWVVWISIFLFLSPSCRPAVDHEPQSRSVPDIRSEHYVVSESRITVRRVVDGDTLILSDGMRVRLIGVDTPETKDPHRPVQYFGREASEFTRQHIEGKPVRLEYDWQRLDKYGRTLAYVYRLPDNFFLNAELVKQGYGHAYTRFPFKYLDLFRAYEREAREKGVGLWKPASGG